MSQDLIAQIARRFIQNRDVKAIQFTNGDYVPDFRMKDHSRHGLGFEVSHLQAHLEGRETYGHYLIDSESRCRMFAFDIDLIKDGGNYVVTPPLHTIDPDISNQKFDDDVKTHIAADPRGMWLDREQTEAREWFKQQMMSLVHKFTRSCVELGIPTAAAYSGNKGVHVYGFLEPGSPSSEARSGAEYVMDLMRDEFQLVKGKNFYGHKNADPVHGFQNFEVEIFPKQIDLKSKALGNLMRLPLGRNLKSSDPTFFLDLKAPMHVMRPHPNPVALLESGNPYV